MNCTDCQNNFSEILDDEIPPARGSDFRAHLASCSSCASAFNSFKKTVQTLHAIPRQTVPADFLIGINNKLDKQSFTRLWSLFSFMGQHKLTASATMATLIVGVISATILQTTPQTTPSHFTGDNSTYTQAITTKNDPSSEEKNYYPGVPYLAARKTEPQTTTPIVQFASTNSRPNSGYYSIPNQRGSPEAYATPHYTSLCTTPNQKPDFHIIIHPASVHQQQMITHSIAANSNWKTHRHNSTLYVTLTGEQLPAFQQLFPPPAPPHKKLDFSPLTSKAEQSLFTISISFD